ncbi:Glycosyl transferase family 25 [Penicillium crustosum]|uniref:Glycosyl transferase family 25 n=1 Tax=Penicillium crustosum TaxID=36656 RepID=UPI0023A48210|nr:Glycosyl transferase family 25 [Penicillium crustosum]KAJ5402811.1 Glycosyl transferase family 25 [Penicillium crustosum]
MVFSASQIRFAQLLFALFGVAFILFKLQPSTNVSTEQVWSDQHDWDKLDAIRNETLGVQKVFAINLVSRPDKRDSIILGSSLSNFHVKFLDGVTPDGQDAKSYPYNWNYDHKTTEYAARRAHINGLQQVVQERLASAIIMEDDSDWDVSIKAQLQSFAHAVRALQFQDTQKTPTQSPYGDDWDILWLGHCGMLCKTDLPFYLTPNDPTIPMPHHFLPQWRDPPAFEGYERPDHSRLTCTANDGVCSMFYAVSYRGAQRILAALSVNPSGLAEEIDIGAQFDVSLGRMCGNGYLRCFAPYPSITGGFHQAGPRAKSSDIHDETSEQEDFFSWGVMYSTMLNINRILKGERTVHATWGDVDVLDVIPGEITMGEGAIYIPKRIN